MGFREAFYRGGARNVAAFAVPAAFFVVICSGCAGGDGEFASGPGMSSFGTATATATSTATAGTGGEPPASTTAGASSTGEGPNTASITNGGTGNTATGNPETSSASEDSDGTDGTTSGGPCSLAEDCNDEDPCSDDSCVNALCQNSQRSCDDGISCTEDACNPTTGVCENLPDDSLCDDANLCNGASTCDTVMDCTPAAPVDCQDTEACTVDACVPASGLCTHDPVTACTAGDGCCPTGCSAADTDCVCTNLAPLATASSNGGGTDATGYGPAKWNDGVDQAGCGGICTMCFGWISNSSTPSGSFMEYQWPSEVTIGSMHIDTTAPGALCNSGGRYVPSGRVQQWNGAAWVDASTWAGATGDISLDFDPPLETTRVRLFDVTAPASGSNSLMFEWSIFAPSGCTP